MLLLSPALLAQGTAPKPATPAPGAKPAEAKESTAPAPVETPKKDDAGPSAEPAPNIPAANGLTADQQKTLVAGMGEVANYIRGVRNLEALDKLNELEQAVGPTHYVENLRGAVYTKMRDFAKARTHFQNALELRFVGGCSHFGGEAPGVPQHDVLGSFGEPVDDLAVDRPLHQ